MNCPRCKCERQTKDGIIQGRQRYKCKECNYRYTVQQKSTAKSKELKRYALQLYLEGLGFRSIGRLLKVSNVSVLNWIRSFGKEVQSLQSENSEIEFVELDEMHSYIGSKKTTVGYGLLLIEMGKSSSISLLGTEVLKQQKNYGSQSEKTK